MILILADDLDKSVFSPTTLDSAWVTEGASISSALATTSLCCPSRVSILKGQYAHNTGLVNNDNSEPGGGVRRQEEIYVRYESGEEEYYDLHNDGRTDSRSDGSRAVLILSRSVWCPTGVNRA